MARCPQSVQAEVDEFYQTGNISQAHRPFLVGDCSELLVEIGVASGRTNILV